jgi:hypothetical protein
MKTYLIQRGKFEEHQNRKGIDSIVSFDYMGAAEFEFGALPESLTNIRNQIDKYGYNEFFVLNKPITIFCKHIHIEEIQLYLDSLANNSMSLHESSEFDTYIKPSKYAIEWQMKRGHTTDFWWDIDNDIMFWKSNKEFENKFKSIISIKPK